MCNSEWCAVAKIKKLCASGCIPTVNCNIHVPAGAKPYETPAIATGDGFFFSSHSLKQAFDASGDLVRKEQIIFTIGGKWCLFSRPPGCAEHLQIQRSRSPRKFSLCNIQFARIHYSFSRSDIMWLQFYLTSFLSNIAEYHHLKGILAAFLLFCVIFWKQVFCTQHIVIFILE